MSHPTTETTWLALGALPALPGLRARRVRDDADYEAMAAVNTAANLADGIPWIPTADHLRRELGDSDGIELATDLVIVERDGSVVAFAGVERVVRGDHPMFEIFGTVHPAHRRLGIGGALLSANLARAGQRAADESFEGPIEAATGAEEHEIGARALLDAAGFSIVRHFFLMRRADLADIPDVPLPDGLELRRVVPAVHRTIFEAEEEAFRDHWGARDHGEDAFRRTYGTPELDTDLWVVAWDGDEVAGVVQTWIWGTENETLGVRRGWLEHISVRRPWRRRGLAHAMTARALTRLREAGMDDAMLGVDSENPSGALGLYERLGFEVQSRSSAYRLVIRP
jgi:mycothiol synthase